MTIPQTIDPKQQSQLLQSSVASTVDLALSMKQLHWNIRGPKFRSIHEFLDVIIDHAREATDVLAERMVTLGVPAVGQRASLQTSNIPEISDDFLKDDKVVELGCAMLDAAIETLREARKALGEIDAVTEDIVIGVLTDLEKDLWMLRSHAL